MTTLDPLGLLDPIEDRFYRALIGFGFCACHPPQSSRRIMASLSQAAPSPSDENSCTKVQNVLVGSTAGKAIGWQIRGAF